MLPPHDEPENLQIRCPACGQRFKVGVDLRDRMVECGSCEHRFRIDDDTILRTKKFYPGERRDTRLDGFARVPHAPAMQPNIETAHYAAEPSMASFEPPSPLRTLTAVVGVVAMISVSLLLVFGASPDGALGGVTLTQRIELAGFASLVGSAMLIYGNPRGRLKAVLVSLVFAGVLLSLPFLCKGGSAPVVEVRPVERRQPEKTESVADKTAELARTIGLDPLIKENDAIAGSGNGTRAVGIWLRNLRLSSKTQVNDYLIRSTGADANSSHLYPREHEEALMVLSGLKQPLEEVAVAAGKLGHDRDSIHVHPELNVVEVLVDNDIFLEGSYEKLQDKANPAFYDLNRRELQSPSLDRVRAAIKRVADAEPKIYRDDITRQLVQLAKESDGPMLGDVSRALGVWALPENEAAVAAVTAAFEKMWAAHIVPERDTIMFLVKRKATSIAASLDAMWMEDATGWESLYGDLGPVIEPMVLKHFQDATSGSLRQSAARLLGRVGTAKSLPVLTAAKDTTDTELKVIVDRAIKTIQERH